MASRWNPHLVIDHRTNEPFTDESAWMFTAELLENGHLVNVIKLRNPPGRTAYVLKVERTNAETIYIKVQLGAGIVLGRSFHDSVISDEG